MLLLKYNIQLMIQNELFRQCLTAIPAEQKAEFDLSFGIAEHTEQTLSNSSHAVDSYVSRRNMAASGDC